MPELLAVGGTLRLAEPLPSRSYAYVDADWARGREGPVAALVVGGRKPDVLAAQMLAGVAVRVAELLGGREPESVEVGGDGVVARLVRALTGAPNQAGGVPDVVVDTGGTAASASAAFRSVADLGLVVVAAAFRDAPRLSLYPDVHVRGLEVVFVAPTAESPATPGVDGAALLETLSVVEDGGVLEPDAAWYRVGG